MIYDLGFTIFLLFLVLFLIHKSLFINLAFADEIDDLQKQIDQLNQARTQSEAATKPLQSQVASLQRQLAQIQANLANLSAGIQKKQDELNAREEKLALQQALLEERVRAYYIRSYLTAPLLVILSSSNGNLFQELSYNQTITKQDRQVITSVTSEVVNLLTDKQKLEKDKASLASLQSQVDQNAKFLGGEVKKAQAYQATLSNQIAQLSARQQALIAAKLASLNIPQSAYAGIGKGCVDDRGIDPGFSPRIAFFTYGVPNRVGLNQYGAKGRAEAGQSAQQILSAYFNADYTSGYNQSISIHVVGQNEYGQSFDDTWNIDDYLKHLYEMPAGWPMEALKSQAIAARSYALASTNNGSSSICPSQSCQVVKKEINDGNWQAAVDATKGVVLTSGGSPIKAWFSSTHGGYVHSSSDIGWNGTPYTKNAQDTSSSVGSFSDLQSNAYDKQSPWFYCDWGSRSNYAKTAWLKPDEVADIINVILLSQRDSSTVTHLSQVDSNEPDTWDASKVRSELQSRGVTPFGSVSNISVSFDTGSGKTTSVSVSGDGGSVNFDGANFKQYFNLRAPANIQIVGPLFNVEKK